MTENSLYHTSRAMIETTMARYSDPERKIAVLALLSVATTTPEAGFMILDAPERGLDPRVLIRRAVGCTPRKAAAIYEDLIELKVLGERDDHGHRPLVWQRAPD